VAHLSLAEYQVRVPHPLRLAIVMDEIMRGMNTALPEPSWEEIGTWLNTHNITSHVPVWCDHLAA